MADEEEVAEKPPKKAKGTRAKIELEGPVDQDVLDRVVPGRSGGKRSPEASKEKGLTFARAIRDPNLKITATRISPTTTTSGEPLGDSYEIMPHNELTEGEIKKELSENRGGRKWHVKVTYPESDLVAAAKTIDNVPGEPVLDPAFGSGLDLSPGGGRGGRGMGGGGGSMDPLLDEGEDSIEEKIENDPEVVELKKKHRLRQLKAKDMEAEAEELEAQARLNAAKGVLSGNGNGHGRRKDEDDEKELPPALKAMLDESRAATKRLEDELARRDARDRERDSKNETKAMIEAATAPLKTMLDALLAKVNTPPPAPVQQGPTLAELMAKLETVKSDVKADTADKINTTLNQIKTEFMSKVDGLANKLDLIGKSAGDPATQALIKLATKEGAGGGGPNDPFRMMGQMTTMMRELAETKTIISGGPADLGSLVVEKVSDLAPEVMNFIERTKAGQQVGEEQVKRMLNDYGQQMYAALDSTIKQEFAKINAARPQQPQALPGPGQQVQPGPQQPGPQPPAAPPFAQQGAQQPAPAPVSAPQGAPPPVPAPQGAPAFAPTGMDPVVADQYRKRVNWLLKLVHHEMTLGIQAMKWPEKAFGELPKDIVDKIVAAENAEQVFEAIRPWADPASLNAVQQFLAVSNPKHEWYREWLITGINWMKQAASPEQDAVVEDEP